MKNPFSNPKHPIDYNLKGEDVVLKQFTGAKLTSNPGDYLILPGHEHKEGTTIHYSYPDILVPMFREYKNKTWHDTKKELHAKNEFMLTVRQFGDMMRILLRGDVQNGYGSQISPHMVKKIMDGILLPNSGSGEFLDARFSTHNASTVRPQNISFHKHRPDGSLEEVTEEIAFDTLMNDIKFNELDMSKWDLEYSTYQGLPTKVNKKVQTSPFPRYLHPYTGRVAGFRIKEGVPTLDCFIYPELAYSDMGVRACKLKEVQIK